jgi:hypothetical protein
MSTLDTIKEKVKEQLDALDAEEYKITLKSQNEGYVFCNRLLGTDEILEDKRFVILANKNIIEKLNVYITPISQKYDYYLIDNVLEEELHEIKATYTICCLIEPFYKNFQVVIKTENLTIPDELKDKHLKNLNIKYGNAHIDSRISPFRLAGFKNMTKKYLCEEF